MKITFEIRVKELAELLGTERLIDKRLAERDKRFVKRLGKLKLPSKQFFLELHKAIADLEQAQR